MEGCRTKLEGYKDEMKSPLLPLTCCLFLLAFMSGCQNQKPTDAQMEAWRNEAMQKNAAMVAAHTNNRQRQQWNLEIQGKTAAGKSVRLTMQELDALATTHIRTRSPHNTSNNPDRIFDFRGVAISKLLDKFGITDSKEVTLVAFDSYRATVSIADLRTYPIVIALERNGMPISRSEGGPLSLVFPYTDYPQLEQKYPDRFWAFYVTNLIVGTEPVRLRVGETPLDAKTISKLPQVTIEEAVGYPIGWPIGKVKLTGVRVRDVLAAAGVTLPENGMVIVRGKAPVSRNALNPIRLAANEVRDCDILFATHWGNEREPIPAKMGGPVTLAFPSNCQARYENQRWLTFVEQLEVSK